MQINRAVKEGNQIPVEKKMRLAQYIRAENMDNRMKLREREKILYGEDSMPPLWSRGEPLKAESYLRPEENAQMEGSNASGTFKLRMAMAVILFIGFLLCDAGQYKIFGYSTNDIYGMISEDYFKLYDSESTVEFPQLTELFE